MWHDHFATSNLKVNDLALMRRQNETLRSLCRGPVRPAAARDAPRPGAARSGSTRQENTKGHPNENLARELMELFTLGIGHYSEDDVKQAARALTGWKLVGDEARFVPSRHDAGDQDDPRPHAARSMPTAWPRLLLEHPATSRRLAWRLCHEFFGEGAVDNGCDRRAGRGPAGARPGHRLGRRDGAPLATVLRRRQPGQSRLEPDRVRRGRGAGPGDVRPVAEHAGAGRLVRAAGPGPVRSAQRRRLARRPGLDHDPIGDRPGELRRGAGRRRVGRPGHAVRPDRPGRSPRPAGAIRRSSRDCCSAPNGPEVPLDDAGELGPACACVSTAGVCPRRNGS